MNILCTAARLLKVFVVRVSFERLEECCNFKNVTLGKQYQSTKENLLLIRLTRAGELKAFNPGSDYQDYHAAIVV